MGNSLATGSSCGAGFCWTDILLNMLFSINVEHTDPVDSICQIGFESPEEIDQMIELLNQLKETGNTVLSIHPEELAENAFESSQELKRMIDVRKRQSF